MGKVIVKRTASRMAQRFHEHADSRKASVRLGNNSEPVRHATRRAVDDDDATRQRCKEKEAGDDGKVRIVVHKTLFVRLTMGGRAGKMQGRIVAVKIAQMGAAYRFTVVEGEATAYGAPVKHASDKTPDARPYVREWDVSGPADGLEFLKRELDSMGLRSMRADAPTPPETRYAMNGRGIGAQGETLGEKAELQAKESARRKADAKATFAACDASDSFRRAETLERLQEFQSMIPDLVAALKKAAAAGLPEFGPAMAEFFRVCKTFGLDANNYIG
jgi:hypothetical protein